MHKLQFLLLLDFTAVSTRHFDIRLKLFTVTTSGFEQDVFAFVSHSAGPAEPVGPVGPWPDHKDSSRMRNQFDNLVTSNTPRSRPDRWSDRCCTYEIDYGTRDSSCSI